MHLQPMIDQRATYQPRSLPPQCDGAAQARIRLAFERAKHPMFLVDDQRRYVAANAPACALYAVDPAQVTWGRMDDYTPPEHRLQLVEGWDRFLTEGRMEGWFRIRLADDEELQIEFSATANALPQRHLFVLLPRLEGIADDNVPFQPWTRFDDAGRLHEALTARECEVIALVAGGSLSCEIAARLLVSPETVKSHVTNAMTKLGAHTRAHAVAIAVTSGEIDLLEHDPPADVRR